MRIALVVPGFSASDDDWCIPVLLTIVGRLTRHADVEIFTLRYPARRGSYDVAGARVHALGGGSAARWEKPALLRRALAQVLAAHRRAPFDAIHALWADEPGAVAVAAARWIGRPAVVSIMGGELVRRPELAYGTQIGVAGRLLVRFGLGGARFVTVGSRQLARATPPRIAGRLKVVPLGVDADRFRPGLDDLALPGRFRILHVASLTPVKDQATLLAAMTEVARTTADAHLHIVGDGPLRSGLEASAAGLGRHVTFHGAVSHERLPVFYGAADVCVVSSRHESQSMVALEACACGCPVVGTAVGILPELEGAARVVPPGDAAGLARALASLAQDASLRARMGRHARHLVERDLRVERTIDTWLALYASA